MSEIEMAVIGGSGLYGMEELEDIEHLAVETPFGKPSGPITLGTLHGERIGFLPRHGKDHSYIPSEVPYRANIHALKQLGVRYIIAVSACGSLREDYEPGHIVVPDQIMDNTKGKRDYTFFGDGLSVHVGVADPFSTELSEALAASVRDVGGIVHLGGTYVVIEGPRFSTKAESKLFRQWDMSVVGMTTSPEVFLANEAEIAYAVMAHVTDYDVWHVEGPVTAEKVVKTFAQNIMLAQRTISQLVANRRSWQKQMAAHRALDGAFALINDWSIIPEQVKRDLAPIIEPYVTE